MKFQLLGAVDALDNGNRIALGGPKQRLVLAHLLLRANEVVPADTLIEEVWGEEPPDAARSALQAYVSRLRKSLGAARLEGRAPGYVFHVEADEVDAIRFEQLVREARARLGHDPGAAAGLLDEALGLWRGSPLADLSDEPSLRAQIARLEELRLMAAEDRIDAAFALGQTPDIAELERLVGRYPLRERFWGMFMLALYRSGRQAEALDAYRRARDLLSDELGIDPSSDLQRLHEQVLRHDPALDLKGEPLRGYRLLERVGEGAFGVVHRASQPQLGREVAIKVIHPRYANDPEFVRRFETEAQLVARLEHPRIVPLYDYWRDVDGAFLVMRFLRGGSLRARIAAGVDAGEAVRVVEQVAEGLDAAHRAGVAHRDVKPENVLFDEEGNAYLADFGIARDVSTSGSDRAAAEDIAALGALLPDMLTGLRPPAADEVIARAGAPDLGHWFPDASSLAAALRDALGRTAGRTTPVAVDVRNPYKGLRAFQEADAADFFGRDRVVGQLVARLSGTGTGSRFLAVVGPSGSGKSSVVRAGFLPALRNGALPGSERWFVVQIQPGPYPFEELEGALLKVAVGPASGLIEPLARGEDSLARAARRVLPDDDSELLIVIDQFEEVFTLVHDEQERGRFLSMLAAAVADPRSRVRLVVTLRADFYDRPLSSPGFGELVADQTLAVPPMAADELERAISGPVERMGVSLEPPLVAEMVAEVLDQPGALPLLQYALTELFDRREGATVPASAYREIGGVSGALGRRAEALYEQLGPPGRDAARQLFLRLVTVGEDGMDDVRRRVLRSELASLEVDRAAMDAAIDAYGGHRLLSFDRDPVTRGPTVEVAHEALLREWSRLRGWVESAREDVRMHRRLDAAAAEWSRAGEDPSFLLSGARLAQFEAWVATTDVAMTEEERRYLAAGSGRRDADAAEENRRRAHEARLERRSLVRLRALIAVLAVMALVASILSAVAVGQRGTAQREADAAQRAARIAAARELASAADANLEVDPERSILLALEAVATTKPDGTVLPEAVDALHSAIAVDRHILTLRDPSTANVAWSPDGRLIATGGTAGGNGQDVVILWDARTGAKVRTLAGLTEDVGYVAFSPDSSRVVSVSNDRLIVWDTATGKVLLSLPERGLEGATFSPDGTRIVLGQNDPSTGAPTVKVLDAATGQDLLSVQAHETGGICQAPVFSPDGGRIAVPGSAGIPIYAATTGRPELTLPSGTCKVVFSPDGRELASSGGLHDSSARVWDATSGQLLMTLQGHTGSEAAMDWSPDGTLLATGGNDGTARVWDARTGKQLLVLSGHAGLVAQVAFSPDGTKLLTGGGDGTARIWDITPAATAEVWGAAGPNQLRSVAYSPDGSTLATTGIFWWEGWDWDASSGRRLQSYPNAWFDAAFDRDGSTLAVLGNEVAVVDASSGNVVRSLHDQGWTFSSVGYAPDGSLVAAGSDNGTAEVWDAHSGQLVGTYGKPSSKEAMSDVAFSPDGKLLAGIRGFGGLDVWDLSGHDLFHVQASSGEGRSVAFSPDGSLLASSGADGAAIWAVPSGRPIGRLSGAGATGAVAFSQNGRLLATGGDDGIARIWSVRSGRQLQILPGHTDQLNGVAFSPDGTRLATVSDDGTLRVYALSAGELARIGRARLTRGFTRAECVQYLHVATCPRSAPSPSASPTTGPSGSPASVAPEGAFRVSIDRGDLQRSGIPRREWAFDAGDYTVTFLDGTWRAHQQLRGTQCGIGPKSCEWDGSGTYTVSGSRITMRFLTEPACFGCTLSADWSLEPTALAMRGFAASVPGRFAPGSGFTAAWSLILGSRPLARAA